MTDSRAARGVDLRRLRVARVAAAGFFLVNGAVFANLLPRLPEVKDAFELTNTQYGFVVIALPVGSLLAGMAPAPLMRRFGSGRVAGVGSVILAALIALAGVAGGMGGGGWLLAAYLAPILVAGMMDAIVDTAQNAQAIDVQKSLGRSILNSMHALWSLGAMLGGLMGAAAVAVQLPLAIHLSLSGTLFAVIALIAQRFALSRAEVEAIRDLRLAPPSPESASDPEARSESRPASVHSTPGDSTAGHTAAVDHTATDSTAERSSARPAATTHRHRALGLVVLISLIAISGAMIEDLGTNWSTLYLMRVLETPAAAAGLGLVALMAAQFVGRLLGDPLVDRLGRVRMARLGAGMAAVGLITVALAPGPAVAVLGFALAGFGSATLVPSAFHAADSVPGLRPGTGLTLAGWLLRAAFLTVSPVVGVASDAVGLRWAILFVPACAIIAALLAGVLKDRQDT